MSRDPKSTYYDAGGIETLDVIKAKLTPEQYRGYLLGNAIKYACRLNFKGSAERDAEKLAVYSAELAALPKAQAEQDHEHLQPATAEVTGPINMSNYDPVDEPEDTFWADLPPPFQSAKESFFTRTMTDEEVDEELDRAFGPVSACTDASATKKGATHE